MDQKIKELCEEYTDLQEDEIQVIQMTAQALKPLANLDGADIFIDCPCSSSEDSVVVAWAKPDEVPSSYEGSVVGMLAKAENEPAVARTFRLGIATKYMKARTQEDNYTIQSVEPIKHNGRVIGVLIRERRSTEENEEREDNDYSKAVEMPVNHILDENSWLMESLDEGLMFVDRRGYITFRNLYARELYKSLGYIGDILGQKYLNVCMTYHDEELDMEEHIAEVRIGSHYLHIRHVPVEKGGIQMAVIVRDITFNREQEKNLVLKSVAIKELHHRVKNNLQTIASLLQLQARRSDSEETKQVLRESINRILAISVTHQLLSESEESTISLKDVLNTVTKSVVRSFLEPNLDVTVELTGDDIVVDTDIATSIALSVNELLQNCMKYAFVGRDRGRVKIYITKGKVYSTVTVSDDGIGFNTENMRKGALGLQLVESMIQDKLHGNFKIKSTAEGTRITFDFLNETMDMISVTD